MAELRPVEEIKDSGIEWVGCVPSDWNVVPIRSCIEEVTEKNKDGFVKNALKFTYGEIVPKTNFDADEDEYVADTILNYYVVSPGTIMINGLNLNFDFITQRVGLVKSPGIITSAYLALAPKDFTVTMPEYLNYLFKSYDARLAFHNLGGGVRKILNFGRLKSQKVCFPCIHEQKIIVNYLDSKCSQIDEIIAEATASIEEYKELKQAVIFEAVTKGLDKNASMKDSNIEFLGLVNASFSVAKISQLNDGLTDGTHGTYERVSNGKLLLSSKNVQEKGLVIGNNESFISIEDHNQIVANGFPHKNDLLLCCIGASIGRCILYPYEEPIAFQRSVVFIRPNDWVLPAFMMYSLLSYSSIEQEKNLVNQSAQAGLYQGLVKKIYITVPDKERQKDIVDYLNKKTLEIDSLIEEKQSLISDLQVYKKSMIYEVVTGKRRVV